MEISRTQRPSALEKAILCTTQVMLERSKGSGLVIEMNLLNGIRMPVLRRMKEVITEHADRIREIELYWIGDSLLKFLLVGIPDSSLRLTSLVLTSSTRQGFTIPTRIMADLSRLQLLDTRGFHFPWYSQSLCALTRLRVESPPPRPSPKRFILCSPSRYARLGSLGFGGFASQTCDIRNIKPIGLYNLKYPRLVFSPGLSNVLSVIVVPVETVVYLHCSEPGSRFASSLSDFFSSMGSRESKKPSYRKLNIHSFACSCLTGDETSTGNPKLRLFFF